MRSEPFPGNHFAFSFPTSSALDFLLIRICLWRARPDWALRGRNPRNPWSVPCPVTRVASSLALRAHLSLPPSGSDAPSHASEPCPVPEGRLKPGVQCRSSASPCLSAVRRRGLADHVEGRGTGRAQAAPLPPTPSPKLIEICLWRAGLDRALRRCSLASSLLGQQPPAPAIIPHQTDRDGLDSKGQEAATSVER